MKKNEWKEIIILQTDPVSSRGQPIHNSNRKTSEESTFGSQ